MNYVISCLTSMGRPVKIDVFLIFVLLVCCLDCFSEIRIASSCSRRRHISSIFIIIFFV